MEIDLSKLADVNAERAILGAVLLDNQALYHCAALGREDFSVPANQKIYTAMATLARSGKPIDPISVFDQLRSSNASVDLEYVADLIDGVCISDISHTVRIVSQFGLRRRYVSVCKTSAELAFDLSESADDCISITHDRLLKLVGDGKHKSHILKDYSFDVYADIERLSNTSPYESIGLPTGIKRLDNATTGLRPGEYWVLGSWTGSGKTACVTQVIVENAKKDIPVLWFTQEMTKRQVMLRMIPGLTEGVVRAKDLRNPRNMSAAQMKVFRETQAVIDTWPLWVNDATSLDIGQLVAHAQMMIRREKIKLIAVDYLQLLKAEAQTRYDRVTKVSESLRELAKYTGVPVIVVSQLSRPEDKKIRPPRPFDLKEAGSIENDAHVIIMPYRPQDRDGHFTGEDLIIVGKQREGPTGSVKVRFSTNTLTFDPRGEDEEIGEMF